MFLQLLYLSNEICSNIVKMFGEQKLDFQSKFLISIYVNTHNIHSFIPILAHM